MNNLHRKSKDILDTKNFYYTVIYHISQGLNPTQIAHKYNCKPQNIYYYTTQLKQSGKIEKVGKGVWILKTSPCKVGKQHLRNNKNIRGHGFQWKLKIPFLKNWDRRSEFLTKNNIKFKLIGINKTTPSITIKKHKIWLAKDSIIIYSPKTKSYFSDSAKSSKNLAIFKFLDIVRSIESRFNISLKINKNYQFSVCRQHYSLIKNELAKLYNHPRRKLEIFYQDGRLWFLIDNSFNLEEAETVDPIKADKDMDKAIKPFFNSLREAPFTAHDIHDIKKYNKELSQCHLDTQVVLKQMDSNISFVTKNLNSVVKNLDLVVKILKTQGGE
jgi:hypothetical protein